MEFNDTVLDSQEYLVFFNKEILPKLLEIEESKRNTIRPLQKQIKKRRIIENMLYPFALFWDLDRANHNFNAEMKVTTALCRKNNIAKKKLSTEIIRLRQLFKTEIFVKSLNQFFNDTIFIPNQKFGLKSLYNSLLFNSYITDNKGEDFLRFYFGDIMLQLSESYIYGDALMNNFSGIFLSVNFNKEFKNSCVVLQEKWTKRQIRQYKPAHLPRTAQKTLHLTHLEHSNFEKHFRVYCDDPIEARFLLSPSLMKRFVEYQNKLGIKIEFSFVNNRLYLKIHTSKDFFEPNFGRKYTASLRYLKENIGIAFYLIDIIKDLDLDNNIWKA